MLIINVKIDSVKTIQEAYFRVLASWIGICTICQTPYHKHDTYLRKTPFPFGPFIVQRVYCKNCKKTHALLPCIILPYSRSQAADREAAIQSICSKTETIEALSERLEVEPRTISRWWQAFRNKSDSILQYTSEKLAQTSQIADWACGNFASHHAKGLKILELIGHCQATFSPAFMHCRFAWLNLFKHHLFCK